MVNNTNSLHFRQRLTPNFWYDFYLEDVPLPIFREILKKQFTKNAHIADVRVIDRKVAECYMDIEAIEMRYYNTDHVRNMLFKENIDPKAKDFLSKFLAGK
ncbi:NADH dehydrogenase [ubiquinone] 1 alpha subcomplex subunit 6 [Aphelenchoides bicaudatus]|nr:NADH dehydrogenase [ubiquinone] 1 alpha subcomplex subunit 6 [Aphelenchoides bicaudatus]